MEPETYQQIFGWPASAAPRFDVVLGDIYEHDWSDSDMIFCNSTCFSAEMMERIYEKTLSCKKGAWFVTMSKRLPHAEKIIESGDGKNDEHLQWEFVLAIKLEMSWGKATVNLQRKRMHPA